MKKFLLVGTDNIGRVIEAETADDVVKLHTAPDDVFQLRELTDEETAAHNANETMPEYNVQGEASTPSEEEDKEEDEEEVDPKKAPVAEKKEVKKDVTQEIDKPDVHNDNRKRVRGEVNEAVDELIEKLITLKENANDGSALPNQVVKDLITQIKVNAAELASHVTHWNNIR